MIPTLSNILDDAVVSFGWAGTKEFVYSNDVADTKMIEKIVDEIKTMTGQNLVINREKLRGKPNMLYVVTDMDPLFPIVVDYERFGNGIYPDDVGVNDDSTEVVTHVEWVRHYGLEANRIVPLLNAYRDGVAAGYKARIMDEDRDRTRQSMEHMATSHGMI